MRTSRGNVAASAHANVVNGTSGCPPPGLTSSTIIQLATAPPLLKHRLQHSMDWQTRDSGSVGRDALPPFTRSALDYRVHDAAIENPTIDIIRRFLSKQRNPSRCLRVSRPQQLVSEAKCASNHTKRCRISGSTFSSAFEFHLLQLYSNSSRRTAMHDNYCDRHILPSTSVYSC